MIDAGTYPAPRLKRIGGESLPSVALTPLPRSRVFSWVENVTATSRRTVSGPRCQGPALLKDCSWYLGTHSAAFNVTVEVGYALNAVTEAGVPLATVRPYTVLNELIDPFAQVSASAGVGFIDEGQPSTNVRWKEPLDLIVDLDQFFPVLAVVNGSANAQLWHGQLRVVEGILRTALEQYF